MILLLIDADVHVARRCGACVHHEDRAFRTLFRTLLSLRSGFCHSRLLLNLSSLMGPPLRPANLRRYDWKSGGGGGGYVTRLNNDSTAYRNLAMELIFLCRFFIQIHEGSSNSSIRLRK